jgi:hypothetical protein
MNQMCLQFKEQLKNDALLNKKIHPSFVIGKKKERRYSKYFISCLKLPYISRYPFRERMKSKKRK